jgi:hypothetical protein
VHDHALRVLSGELGDQRDEAMPEGERVPGMEAPVRELGHAVEREVVQVEQLPDPCEVEEAVALDRRCRNPQDEPDDRAPEERP